jgi:hypothetical protein
MYTLEIEFQTEEEMISLTREKFATILEASTFAIDFVKPYIEKQKIAQGEWRVYKSDNPDIIERYCKIESLHSLRVNEAASRL